MFFLKTSKNKSNNCCYGGQQGIFKNKHIQSRGTIYPHTANSM